MTVEKEKDDYLSEKSPLIQSGASEMEINGEEPFYKRHKKWTICCTCFIFFLIFGVFFAVFAVPPIAALYMQNLLDKSVLEIQELELLYQEGSICYVRIQAIFTYDAPIEINGETEETKIETYIENPENRTEHLFAGYMVLPKIYSTGTQTFLNLTTTVEVVSDSAIHLFLGDILVTEYIKVWGKGEVLVTAHIPIYKMTLSATLDKEVSVRGLQGMDFTLNTMYLVNSTADDVTLIFDITVHNPSVVYTSFPLTIYAADLGIFYNDTWIGYCTPDQLVVGKEATPNLLNGTLVRTPENEAFIAEFLSKYIVGDYIFLYVAGTAKVWVGLGYSEENPADIYVPWLLPGIQDELIQDIAAPIDEVSPIRLILVAEGKLFNPLEFDVMLLHVEFDAYVGHPCNRTLGRVNESYDDGFVFPSRTPVCLGDLALKVTLDDLACMTAAAVTGMILWALDGVMIMSVGLFEIAIPFDYGPVSGRIGKCRL